MGLKEKVELGGATQGQGHRIEGPPELLCKEKKKAICQGFHNLFEE